MKTYVLPLVGAVLGAVIAFSVFGLLFNTPLTDLFPAASLPLGLAVAASFVLTWADPGRWKILAASVALPNLLLATVLFVMLWIEGRGDGGWVVVAGAALCACFAPS